MRQRLIVGNWKMNTTRFEALRLVSEVQSGLPDLPTGTEVVFAPPSLWLAPVAQLLAHPHCKLAAQNLSEHLAGAYTGEVSAAMLREVGCHYVIVGHSERRHLYGETNTQAAAKAAAALQAGIRPIFCVGETLAQREADKTWTVIAEQLDALTTVLKPEQWCSLVVAYEPVWAIGTGRTASPGQAQEVHGQIREWLQRVYPDNAGEIPLLYGGSVKADNAVALLQEADIDGALVGGASLKSDEFIAIVSS